MMKKYFCSVTLDKLLYNDKWLSHKLSQVYKHYPCSILSLFVVLYETRYDQTISSLTNVPFIDTFS